MDDVSSLANGYGDGNSCDQSHPLARSELIVFITHPQLSARCHPLELLPTATTAPFSIVCWKYCMHKLQTDSQSCSRHTYPNCPRQSSKTTTRWTCTCVPPTNLVCELRRSIDGNILHIFQLRNKFNFPSVRRKEMQHHSMLAKIDRSFRIFSWPACHII